MNVDATWFDSDDESPNTKYAGLTDAEISVTHKADLTYKNLAKKKFCWVLPLCTIQCTQMSLQSWTSNSN